MLRRRPLPAAFYARHSAVVAPELLGKVLVAGARSGRIVEVEAYGGTDDAASHAHRGPTKRNATMFGPPGGLYVYFTYGMHWCANAVTGPVGDGQAVLLRAIEPLTGLNVMRAARPRARSDRDLADGPAKLCQALGIDGTTDGVTLLAAGERSGLVTIVDDGTAPPSDPIVTTRIGITKAADRPWRFVDPDWLGARARRSPVTRASGATGRAGGGPRA